ncbi:TIGR04255 family protein [Janthinobacterium fluminis]|uniref:TIGR04255 family protein n=1 Tax=Janthinobacterium fluminis TaxID=2987524 RepID=A0ABT5JZY0_9BURK|nr:TIGR04255 family protein [Janthinobacterium fluminis]MDC8758224.1 TIGR04255 family protein [Janthinobacterium fluminis]
MGKKMRIAPVYYTVAQVQFNPILDLDSYLPSIQSNMREKRFPDFKHEVHQRFVFPLGTGGTEQSQVPSLSRQSRFYFGDMAERTSFLLETNAITLQTTAYETFESFLQTLLDGLKILNQVLQLDFVERIGLRYLDAVHPVNSSDKLEDYLTPQVLGLANKLPGELAQSVSETVTLTAAGQLVSRVTIRSGGIGLPDDLATRPPTIDPRFTTWTGLHASVDTDAAFVKREEFDLAAIKSRLTALHDIIEQSFKATVTDHALAAWA